ncbi:MAG: DUF1062 domain-containing protein [Enterocloster asparagiformis]|nr:DUF1062 domain-containing protein [Enterocloster asparagiformis]
MKREYRKKWHILPDRLPAVLQKCSRCGKRTEFENSGRFRVNANGRMLDVWLIYRCKTCKATWNMEIYERVLASELDSEEYEHFLNNDIRLAAKYGCDAGLFARNKVEMSAASAEYKVQMIDTPVPCKREGWSEVEIHLAGCLKLRVDALFAGQLGISRSRVKQLCLRGLICGSRGPVRAGDRVRDGEVFLFLLHRQCGKMELLENEWSLQG